MAGYSKTPLWKKLGLKEGLAATVHQPPVDYFDWLADGPRVDWTEEPDMKRPFIHLFNSARDELALLLSEARHQMPKDGKIWASWPKKASNVPTDITENVIRKIALPLGLVDVKVCAVSEVWSGLKLVVRKELR
jgi:hypothetical protein